MNKDKELAIKMRRDGKSYSEIRAALKISKSSLSNWFSGEPWSKEIKNKLSAAAIKAGSIRLEELNKVRGERLTKAYESARVEAQKEFEHLKYNPAFIAGMMLYWGEGDKTTRHHVRLTNVEPEMIKLYVFFLTQVLGIPKTRIRGHILLYRDLDDWLCRAYWTKASGLSNTHFLKSTVIAGEHKTRRLSFGICVIDVSSTYLKVKMMEWLKLLPKELMDKQYYENIGGIAAMVQW